MASATVFVQHQRQCVRRYQGTDYEESDSDSIDILNDTIPNSPDVHVDEEQHVQLEFTDHDNHVEEEQNLQLGNMANVTPHSHQTIRGPNVLVTRDVEDVAIPVVQVTMDGISPENRRKSCLLAAENRLRQSGPPLPTLWEEITASMDVVSSATAAPLGAYI